jgi:hypothetical protein
MSSRVIRAYKRLRAAQNAHQDLDHGDLAALQTAQGRVVQAEAEWRREIAIAAAKRKPVLA